MSDLVHLALFLVVSAGVIAEAVKSPSSTATLLTGNDCAGSSPQVIADTPANKSRRHSMIVPNPDDLPPMTQQEALRSCSKA